MLLWKAEEKSVQGDTSEEKVSHFLAFWLRSSVKRKGQLLWLLPCTYIQSPVFRDTGLASGPF
jgi:hypothetical protein